MSFVLVRWQDVGAGKGDPLKTKTKYKEVKIYLPATEIHTLKSTNTL